MQQPRPANGGGLASQRTKRRKQSVPQRSCLDPAINNDLAKRYTPSALLAAAESDSETNTQIKPVALAHIPSSVPRRVLAPVAVGPISPFSAPAPAPTTAAATATTAGGAASASAFYAHLAAHAAFTMTIQQTSQQMPSKGRGRGKQQPKVGMCSFCGEIDSPMWRKGPDEYPHLCNRCGMRYCRYVKQDKDPFTDSIYNEIVQKREVRAQPALASAASMTSQWDYDATVPSEGPEPAGGKVKKAGKGKHSREAGAAAAVAGVLEDMRGQQDGGVRSSAGQKLGAHAAHKVGSDVHNEDGDISEQGSAKKHRGIRHLPDAPLVPSALDPKNAAAGAGLAHLLQILQGQNFDAEQPLLRQLIPTRAVGLAVRTGQQHAANPSAATIAHQQP